MGVFSSNHLLHTIGRHHYVSSSGLLTFPGSSASDERPAKWRPVHQRRRCVVIPGKQDRWASFSIPDPNGRWRLCVPAHVAGHAVCRQPGCRSSGNRDRRSMVWRQTTEHHGRIRRWFTLEGVRRAGPLSGVVPSHRAVLDRGRRGLRGAAPGSHHRDPHAGRNRGWNHGALPHVPRRLCEGIMPHSCTVSTTCSLLWSSFTRFHGNECCVKRVSPDVSWARLTTS